MNTSGYKSISDLFRDLAKNFRDDRSLTPIEVGTHLALASGFHRISAGINITTAFVCWWRSDAENRIVWRVKPETSGYIQQVGLYFIPKHPPASWSGDCIIIESTDKRTPVFGDVFSMATYQVKTETRDENRYYFVLMALDGAVWVTSIRADLQRTDDIEIGDMPFLWEGKDRGSDVIQQRTIAAARFCFAFSYYAIDPNRVDIRDMGGPVLRGDSGKPVKRHGRTIHMWRYLDLSIRSAGSYQEGIKRSLGPLNKDNLTLSPVLVSPYIRRVGEKIVIVDEHHSHRWKRETVGIKKTV